MDVAHAISLSFLVTGGLPVLFFLTTGDPFYPVLIAALLIANVLVEFIKQMFGGFPWGQRPMGARACDAFCVGGPVAGRPGFPSGHLTTATVFVVAMWSHTGSPLVLGLGIPWIVAMGWARWFKRCHTVPQIVGGAVFGTLLGYSLGPLYRG